MQLRAVRGMHDILPEQVSPGGAPGGDAGSTDSAGAKPLRKLEDTWSSDWHRLEGAFRAHAELHGYGEVRTPMLESTALFVRQVGETTDIVEKEMYSFERHGDQLTVRPEGTAGAARAYVEHGVHAREPVTRWYYLGPMFRGERPAKGRYRQFYQAGCELFGDPGPLCDAEMIDFVGSFLRRVGLGGFTVHINSLGSSGTRARYRDALQKYFQPLAPKLSEDSQRRLEKNPLRILDSKDPRDQEAAQRAPSILEVLDEDDAAHYRGVLRYLDVLGVPYVADPMLVRGLDYYTRTLFEFKAADVDLGAQNTLVGGGRYDEMVQGLGGPKVPAIGFAMGLERILLSMGAANTERWLGCFVAPIGREASEKAIVLARDLRALGVRTEVDGRGRKVGAMLGRADKLGARLCVIIGENEVGRGVVKVKDLAGRVEDEVPLEGAARVLADRVAAATTSAGGAALRTPGSMR